MYTTYHRNDIHHFNDDLRNGIHHFNDDLNALIKIDHLIEEYESNKICIDQLCIR